MKEKSKEEKVKVKEEKDKINKIILTILLILVILVIAIGIVFGGRIINKVKLLKNCDIYIFNILSTVIFYEFFC